MTCGREEEYKSATTTTSICFLHNILLFRLNSVKKRGASFATGLYFGGRDCHHLYSSTLGPTHRSSVPAAVHKMARSTEPPAMNTGSSYNSPPSLSSILGCFLLKLEIYLSFVETVIASPGLPKLFPVKLIPFISVARSGL